MLEKIRTMRNRLIAPAVITVGLGVAVGIIYATNGSTLPEDNKIANDWQNACGVEVNLQQSGRISLDLTRYGKDILNKTSFFLPASCNTSAELNTGDEIVDKFRWGSFFTEGFSSSSWNISVQNDNKPSANANRSECSLELTVRERRAGFLTTGFIKDYWNAYSFDWKVPCEVHDKVDIGHNFVTDPWRTGSVAKRVLQRKPKAVSMWSVEVTGKNGPS